MTYESGYEIVVGVRLVPTRPSAYTVGGAKLPWSEALGKKDKGYYSIFATESHRMSSQRQAVQELLEVVQPFDSPSTLLRPFDGAQDKAQDSAGHRRCPEVPPEHDEGFIEGTRLRTAPAGERGGQPGGALFAHVPGTDRGATAGGSSGHSGVLQQMKVVSVVGARPQFIKAAPVGKAL